MAVPYCLLCRAPANSDKGLFIHPVCQEHLRPTREDLADTLGSARWAEDTMAQALWESMKTNSLYRICNLRGCTEPTPYDCVLWTWVVPGSDDHIQGCSSCYRRLGARTPEAQCWPRCDLPHDLYNALELALMILRPEKT